MNLLITITLQLQSLTICMLLTSPYIPYYIKKDIIYDVLKWLIWIILITFIIRFGRCKQFITNTWITNSLLTFKEVYSSYCFSLLVSTTCFWVYFFFLLFTRLNQSVCRWTLSGQYRKQWFTEQAIIKQWSKLHLCW